MGWAQRSNPRSFTSDKPERDVLHARLHRFAESCPTRADFDLYCDRAHLTDEERAYVAQFLTPEACAS